MADWTVEQVIEWLRREGFGEFGQNFQDRNINGAGLLALRTGAIRQLLTLPNTNELQNEQLVDQFKQKLHQLKQQYNLSSTHRKVDSTAQSSSSVTTSDLESYTKNVTLSTDKIGSSNKFFHNSSFRARFQQYLHHIHHINCQIQFLETQEIYLTLTGQKSNVKAARETITNLFQSIQTKTYENEETDQQMIYWSQNIISDAILPVLQYIMDQQKFFTLWEKTAMFYGHLKVSYFTDRWFIVSEKQITEILQNEILYVENLPMPEEKTVNFLKTIDQYRSTKQNPELAIIYCKYPYTREIKISLFGRKNLVKRTRKQLQSIVNRHTMKIFSLKMNDYQHAYLLDNCLEQAKDIEEEYKDDSVKIRIRQKDFSAPQYLAEKIRQKINEFMFHTLICQYQTMGNSIVVSTQQHEQIQRLLTSSNCRIEKKETRTSMEVYSIPKALSSSSNTSNAIIEQSQDFSATLSVRKISIAHGSIEVHLTNRTKSIPKDITILASASAAAEEGIEHMNTDGYVETRNRQKILFQHWSPIAVTDDKTKNRLKRSIEKFLSAVFQNITAYCSDVKTIGFITSEWENLTSGQQLFVEYLINNVKQELEMRKTHWRILFVLTDRQKNLYGEFIQIFNRLQIDRDGFAQFSCPVTILQITLLATSTVNLRTGEKGLTDYMQKNILADILVSNEVDFKQWDQHTINVFYKYCLSQSVLPMMDLMNHFQIRLIGPTNAVRKTLERSRLMNEIFKERSNLRVPPPVTPRTSVRGEKIRANPMDPNGYNIYFSFCPTDRMISQRIITRLTTEGYSVCQTPSDPTTIQPLIEKSDVVLIAFSEDYSNDAQSKLELSYAKSTGKKLIPFVIRPLTDENAWLSSITIADLFYQLFDCEIEIEFKDDFDLEYDRLLSTLLHYTKPGVIGRTYPQPAILSKIIADHEEIYFFGRPSLALQKITPDQRQERERVYKQEVAKRMEQGKFPDEDINELVESLKVVSNYLEAILRGEDPDAEPSTDESDRYHRPYPFDETSKANAHEFLGCIQRWLKRAPNVIAGNLSPFTPTGDINDAIFIIHRTADDQKYQHIYEPMDLSPPDKYFSDVPYDGWILTNEKSHEYFQKLIQSTKPISDMYMMIEENERAWDTISRQINDEEGSVLNEQRTPEEMRKIEELDNPNRVWKTNPSIECFMKEKLRNILQLKQFDEEKL